MQLQGAVARAAAVVEEFRAVYLPVLIFLTGANNSSSVPSETKKRERKSTCLFQCAPGEEDMGFLVRLLPGTGCDRNGL